MTPEQFAYWLQGFVEMANSKHVTDTQWLQIKDHLSLVFDKQTPVRTSSSAEGMSEKPKNAETRKFCVAQTAEMEEIQERIKEMLLKAENPEKITMFPPAEDWSPPGYINSPDVDGLDVIC